jgi:hypothetical protein
LQGIFGQQRASAPMGFNVKGHDVPAHEETTGSNNRRERMDPCHDRSSNPKWYVIRTASNGCNGSTTAENTKMTEEAPFA